MNRLVRFTLSLLLAVLALPAFPQGIVSSDSPIGTNDYGVNASNYLMIPGTAFVPSNSATGYIKPFLFLQRTGGGDSEFTHALTLPPGALIENVTAYVKDTNATQDVTLRMCIVFALPGTGTAQDLNCDQGIGVTPVSTSGTPGLTALVLNVNRTFLNLQNLGTATNYDTSHVILVHLGATDATTMLHSVKVQWKRQISPAPATASFTDVPTGHVFFAYVEALKASGITAGCAPGLYCPDQPVTRGQMAAFLSKALGLHWAP